MAKKAPRGATLDMGMEAAARNLRVFGYPDATAAMMREVYAAWLAGKRGRELPHGVLGMMAEDQFEKNAKLLASLPDRQS